MLHIQIRTIDWKSKLKEGRKEEFNNFLVIPVYEKNLEIAIIIFLVKNKALVIIRFLVFYSLKIRLYFFSTIKSHKKRNDF